MNKVKGMATCNVCGRDFPLIAEEHYIARANEENGVLPALKGTTESNLFDAFDCPHCGCQNIMQKRQRKFEEEVIFENTEDDCCRKEHDGCEGCKHEEKGIHEDPCWYCQQSYKDNYERREEE